VSTVRHSTRLPEPLTLSPAEHLALMSGCYLASGLPPDQQDPRARHVRGSFELFQSRHPRNLPTADPLRLAWAAAADALLAEGRAYGFVPYFALGGRVWTRRERAAEQRWREDFFASLTEQEQP
jgi:hypothetical protein